VAVGPLLTLGRKVAVEPVQEGPAGFAGLRAGLHHGAEFG